ncbi:MAG: hybrid sensor histidine kinase/response regulator [Chloroflexi bacterium]|nr:hybrid sensor histidine kinase/response regulator [Chloroflexota bacterium]
MKPQATILYIEDDKASQILIQRVLTHAGYHVLIADRALDGIDLAHKHRPDLILTDINLPDMSGREITVRLRSDPRLASVPIVAITSYSHTFERDKTFAAGVSGYITKPVDVSSLLKKIEEYLHGTQDKVNEDALTNAQQAYKYELVERLEANVRALEVSNRNLRRLDQIKEDFIQLTAHELRTPLTTVYGYSRLIQTSGPVRKLMEENEEAAACLGGLIDSIERLNVVISEIITVSRIASGRLDLKLGPTNLADVMDRALKGYAQVIAQRSLVVSFEPADWPPPFYADMALLELALSNILGNAIKYTPDGGTIKLRARVKDGRAHLSMQDSGIGIDPEDQKHIFERFYTAGDTQLHSTSKTAFRGGGLGLGLAICRGVVEAHGGKIWVESKGCDEKTMPGSIFHIELPLQTSMPITPPPRSSF